MSHTNTGTDLSLWPLHLFLCLNSERMGLQMDQGTLRIYMPVTGGSLHIGFTGLTWRLKEKKYTKFFFPQKKKSFKKSVPIHFFCSSSFLKESSVTVLSSTWTQLFVYLLRKILDWENTFLKDKTLIILVPLKRAWSLTEKQITLNPCYFLHLFLYGICPLISKKSFS